MQFPHVSVKGVIISLLFSLIPVATLFFSAITSENVNWLPYIIVAIIVFLLAFFYSYYRELTREQADKRAELFKSLVSYLDEEKVKNIMTKFFELMTKGIGKSRANIMLVEQEGGNSVLKIKHHLRMKGAPDLNCIWEKREGNCGLAWSTGKARLLDLSGFAAEKDRENTLKNELGISSNNIACTRNVISILSVPLFDPANSDNIIGVLNCDSRLSATDSGLNKSETSAILITIGKIISHILKIQDIIKQEGKEGVRRNEQKRK